MSGQCRRERICCGCEQRMKITQTEKRTYYGAQPSLKTAPDNTPPRPSPDQAETCDPGVRRDVDIAGKSGHILVRTHVRKSGQILKNSGGVSGDLESTTGGVIEDRGTSRRRLQFRA
jgi:hypothetical protein